MPVMSDYGSVAERRFWSPGRIACAAATAVVPCSRYRSKVRRRGEDIRIARGNIVLIQHVSGVMWPVKAGSIWRSVR